MNLFYKTGIDSHKKQTLVIKGDSRVGGGKMRSLVNKCNATYKKLDYKTLLYNTGNYTQHLRR